MGKIFSYGYFCILSSKIILYWITIISYSFWNSELRIVGSETVIKKDLFLNFCGLFLRDFVTTKLERYCLLIFYSVLHIVLFFVVNKYCINNITKTRLYNFDPLKPHFYTVKLGFTEVYIIFLFLLKTIDCGYSLESE